MVEPKCHHILGCHACPVERLKEDFRAFRAAIVQFMTERDKSKMLQESHSMISKIDEWYEPHTEDYQSKKEG